MKRDIENINDIERIVRSQYDLLLNDPDTAPKFSHLTIEEHFPKIFGFWEMVIFSKPMAYTGNAFQPHLKLELQKIHFEKWISFFNHSVDSEFEGPLAEKAKNHAKLMAAIFQPKLGIQ